MFVKTNIFEFSKIGQIILITLQTKKYVVQTVDLLVDGTF